MYDYYSTEYFSPEVPDVFTFPGIGEIWSFWTDVDDDGGVSSCGYECHSIDQAINSVLCLEHTIDLDDLLAELPF